MTARRFQSDVAAVGAAFRAIKMNDFLDPNSDPENKRTAPRWSLRLRCRFLSEGKAYDGVMTDLSAGGAFVEAKDCPLAGSEIKVMISIASREFEFPGVVRHSGWFLQDLYNGYGFGIEFGPLSENAELLIQKILQRLNTPAPIRTILEP